MTCLARLIAGFTTWVLAAVLTPALAQDNYPSRVIRMVVGSAAGSTSDVLARQMIPKLSAQLNNVSVIVENKIGANGNIGVDFVAKSKPDGYTLMVNTATVALSRATGETIGYDLFNDLTPVVLLASGPQWLITTTSLPVNTPAQFIAHLKANPDKLSYASTGNVSYLSTLLFLQMNGLTSVYVPYKDRANAIVDLVSGRTQFFIPDTTLVMPLAREKRIKVLAVTSLKRYSLLPDVPTLDETVMPGFEMANWFGVLTPKQTPPAIIKRINAEMTKLMSDAELKTKLAQEGLELRGSTPEEYDVLIKKELERWTRVIKTAGVKFD